ncbi:MAG: pilus assembly protein TadG-related protein [Candidatus Omnitrophica bacterium]|nr:pilus assembly protein TadG-related protein [Candidatus Omnitrophota bacterium]
MFTYFHENKFFGNQKGQLTALFIVIIVVLVIMAMVTVSLTKVSFMKTESSNATDSAALATGAVMANIFNSIVQANDDMEAKYQQFLITVSAEFAAAQLALLLGETQVEASLNTSQQTKKSCSDQNCPDTVESMVAAGQESLAKNYIMETFLSLVESIIVTITAYSIGTFYYYKSIRKMAEEGRNSAIKMGHQFAFMNSGIGGKLKEGKPPAEVTDPDARRNYRDEFSKFMDIFSNEDLVPANEYTYSWIDGSGGKHYIKSKVETEKLDTFKLKITAMPWEAEIALLMLGTGVGILFLYSLGGVFYGVGCICYALSSAFSWFPPLKAAFEVCQYVACLAGNLSIISGNFVNKYVEYQLNGVRAALLIASLGVFPGFTIRDDSGDVMWATICWLEDIVHDRKVRVDTWAYHEGTDMGLWQAKYPQTHSYSIIDFTNNCKIYPPDDENKKHDPSIVATDVIGIPQTDPDPHKDCPYATEECANIEKEISDSLAAADEYDAQAKELEKTITLYQEQGMSQEHIAEMSKLAQDARGRAEEARKQVGDLETKKEDLKEEYAQCF